jgi:hypothetical protein
MINDTTYRDESEKVYLTDATTNNDNITHNRSKRTEQPIRDFDFLNDKRRTANNSFLNSLHDVRGRGGYY